MEKIEWSRSKRLQKKKKKRKWVYRVITLSILAVFIIGGYLFYQVWGALAGTYDPLNRGKSSKRDTAVTMDDPFTILLIGSDNRKASSDWRPDVLILAAVNPHTNSVKMVSIPRDTYTKIANTDQKTKINASAYWGKPEVNPKGPGPVTNTALTVEHLLNVPVDYYVRVNFQGFIDVVDALGGVDVNVKFPFSQQHFGGEVIPFKPGPKHLNGNEALAYVRMRKQDPRGDAGRNERQREVMTNLMDRAMSLSTLGKVDELIKAVGDNLQLGIDPKDIPRLQSIYKKIPKKNIQNVQINGENKRLDLWYYFIPDSERQRLSDILRKQLELKKEPIEPMHTELQDAENNQGSGMSTADTGTQETSDQGQAY
ncbi:LCP family glycopolymer transferase [Marinithermofilum abyssi]|uniref:LCP family glycopolymer transferase n=1 Tax=Marinithermofilum abyssi TaxID=1571185 RepID=UPI0016645601|nr:LCP family protein [Marinithermofilum abyssi]